MAMFRFCIIVGVMGVQGQCAACECSQLDGKQKTALHDKYSKTTVTPLQLKSVNH